MSIQPRRLRSGRWAGEEWGERASHTASIWRRMSHRLCPIPLQDWGRPGLKPPFVLTPFTGNSLVTWWRQKLPAADLKENTTWGLWDREENTLRRTRDEEIELRKDEHVKEELFSQDGRYYTILVRKTDGWDRWRVWRAECLGEQTQVSHGHRYGGCWGWVENKSHIVRDLIKFTVSSFRP